MLIPDPRSQIRIFFHLGSRIEGSTKQGILEPDPLHSLKHRVPLFISYCDKSYIFCIADTGGVGEELHDVKFFLLDSAGDIQGKKLQTLQSTLTL